MTYEVWLITFRLKGDDVEGRLQELRMPAYERGDYVKVEFQDETTVIGEWMWLRVESCDDEKRLVYGVLDNEPVNDYAGKVKLGAQLAVAYDNIREHKSAAEFRSRN